MTMYKKLITQSSPNKLIAYSPAKINLFLEVFNKREDGFHEIKSVIQSISLFDKIEFELTDKDEIKVETIPYFCPQEDNLIYKITSYVKENYRVKDGIRIRLFKKIPIGGGLGGGSANLTFTLAGLKRLWKLEIDKAEALKIVSLFSSDAPFFISGGTQIAEGRGEKLTQVNWNKTIYYLICYPGVFTSTREIYSRLHLTKQAFPLDYKRLFARAEGSDIINFDGIFNRLEEQVFKDYPQIRHIKELLQEKLRQAKKVFITGSGSCIVAVFKDLREVKRSLNDLQLPNGCKIYTAKTLSEWNYLF